MWISPAAEPSCDDGPGLSWPGTATNPDQMGTLVTRGQGALDTRHGTRCNACTRCLTPEQEAECRLAVVCQAVPGPGRHSLNVTKHSLISRQTSPLNIIHQIFWIMSDMFYRKQVTLGLGVSSINGQYGHATNKSILSLLFLYNFTIVHWSRILIRIKQLVKMTHLSI